VVESVLEVELPDLVTAEPIDDLSVVCVWLNKSENSAMTQKVQILERRADDLLHHLLLSCDHVELELADTLSRCRAADTSSTLAQRDTCSTLVLQTGSFCITLVISITH
jgi:hypothetical protein